jgi:hypothetical protein
LRRKLAQQDLAKLRRFTPDFTAMSISAITFNRSGDRGFARWSAGWTGGTFRLTRVNGEWRCETISNWIA